MWSLWLIACDPGFPEAFDYHLDRPRVLAVRVWPAHLASSEPRQIEALALGPEPIVSQVAHTCAVPGDVPVYLEGLECIERGNGVRISTALPATWLPPDLSDLDCPAVEPFICSSRVPVRITATDAAGDVGLGIHHTQLNASPDPIFSGTVELDEIALQLTAHGAPRAGEALELTVSSLEAFRHYHWYVDAGTLLGTGRTVPHELIWPETSSHNTLQIPPDHQGELRIAVVGVGGSWIGGYDAPAWDVLTVEVP